MTVATPTGLGGSGPEIGAHADAALRVVRVVLGVLSCFVVGAYRLLTGPPSWGSLTAILVAIIATMVILNWISTRPIQHQLWAWITQTLDIGASVSLAVVLDEPLGQQSWVLLAVPVVSAAVRHGTAASVLSWAGGSAGYIAVALAGGVSSVSDVTVLARIPGALLALAITIGLLARWMREGWEIQNELTAAIAIRERRLAIIEQTGHDLNNLPPNEALELCTNRALALGFDAAFLQQRGQDRPLFAVGALNSSPTPPTSTSSNPRDQW